MAATLVFPKNPVESGMGTSPSRKQEHTAAAAARWDRVGGW